MGWKLFQARIADLDLVNLQALQKEAAANWDEYHVYPLSIHFKEGAILYLAKELPGKKLIVYGGGNSAAGFTGEFAETQNQTKVCELTHENAEALRRLFPFTAPVSLQQYPVTIGLGDRLGIASPGHLQLLQQYPEVRPVLAQQSMRELNLTGRDYREVLDAATWAVFQEDYQGGFGADGDHLKTAAEVKMALDCGFTMITLDCSEQIANHIPGLAEAELVAEYQKLPAEVRTAYEKTYLNTTFHINDLQIHFNKRELQQVVLIYHQAIHHMSQIYRQLIRNAGRFIDFEISIDETLTATTPQAHFLVANELQQAGVVIANLAPRFCGEFQKGIDYIGDPHQFSVEFKQHAKIAAFFGYKLSVHSGSDKFTVFPIIGKLSGGKFHLKTAGTNWLEAVRVVAQQDPELFRALYAFALEHLEEAKKYYHISADPERVPPLASLPDQKLAELLSQDDARQIIHITYGLILQAKDGAGGSLFKERLFSLLSQCETEYAANLKHHIGHHLEKLGL